MKKTLGDFKISHVSDGDTVGVDRPPMPNSTQRKTLRLLHLDTEETENPKRLGPVTAYGKEVKRMAKEWFAKRGNKAELRIDGDMALCGYYNRPLVHVFCEEEHYQQYAIANGWTPYFTKYGYSVDYHGQLAKAQEQAQKDRLGIWSNAMRQRPENQNRPYDLLCKWWNMRAEQIQIAREAGKEMPLLELQNGRDYAEAMRKARQGEAAQVFGALKRPHNNKNGGQGLFVVQVRMDAPFYVYISPNSAERREIIDKIDSKFISNITDLPDSLLKANYAFIRGTLSIFEQNGHHIPEIVITKADQVSDKPFVEL